MLRLILMLMISAGAAQADPLADAFARIRESDAAGNYPKAMKEAEAVHRELHGRHLRKLRGFLADEVAGFRGEPWGADAPAGAQGVSRSYRKGNLSIEAALQEFSATQRAMLDMAQWGMRMGAQMLGESLSLEGCPANLESRAGQDSAAMTVELGRHARLRLELRGSEDGAVLKAFAGALRLGELDRYLRAE
jgi:hypothetical protein